MLFSEIMTEKLERWFITVFFPKIIVQENSELKKRTYILTKIILNMTILFKRVYW